MRGRFRDINLYESQVLMKFERVDKLIINFYDLENFASEKQIKNFWWHFTSRKRFVNYHLNVNVNFGNSEPFRKFRNFSVKGVSMMFELAIIILTFLHVVYEQSSLLILVLHSILMKNKLIC